ncbi:MAG TPA: DUF1611 domain-containing protein [Rhodopirellula sp.]|nr:MAG: hypothetical protein CBD74_10030 [Saprospirales bacterium TMED214]HBV62188.1 DUF1611 domain-containing protein [Rhodopirellula sp.]
MQPENQDSPLNSVDLVSTAANRQMVILTDGHSNPLTAKTACSVLRYCEREVIAVLDKAAAGQTAEQLLGTGGNIPVIADLNSASDAKTLLIGIAPPGGKIPEHWRPIVMNAIARGMNILSGLHDFLSQDPEFAAAAATSGTELIDVRNNDEHDVANRRGLRPDCLRILTIGQDCCVGKMVTSIELTQDLIARQSRAKFIATGQTGIMISGGGCPIDCVVSDFISGAVEKQILANQDHEILCIEGQGSLAHPRYSAVTLGLLHGSMPHGMVLCYEAGRKAVHGMPDIGLTSLAVLKDAYESAAKLMMPSQVIGIAMNSRLLSAEAAEDERSRIREEFKLPVCDVFRHGPAELSGAVLKLQQEIQNR